MLEEEKTNGMDNCKNLHISSVAHRGAGKKGGPQRTSSSTKGFDQYATYPIAYTKVCHTHDKKECIFYRVHGNYTMERTVHTN